MIAAAWLSGVACYAAMRPMGRGMALAFALIALAIPPVLHY